jgi:hypothetical protein
MFISDLLEQVKAIIIDESDVQNHYLWLKTIDGFQELMSRCSRPDLMAFIC